MTANNKSAVPARRRIIHGEAAKIPSTPAEIAAAAARAKEERAAARQAEAEQRAERRAERRAEMALAWSHGLFD